MMMEAPERAIVPSAARPPADSNIVIFPKSHRPWPAARVRHAARCLLTYHPDMLTTPTRAFLCTLLTARKPLRLVNERALAGWMAEARRRCQP